MRRVIVEERVPSCSERTAKLQVSDLICKCFFIFLAKNSKSGRNFTAPNPEQHLIKSYFLDQITYVYFFEYFFQEHHIIYQKLTTALYYWARHTFIFNKPDYIGV